MINMDMKESLQRLDKLKFKRALRQNLTPAEKILWQELRGRKLQGTKWKRQESIDQFIADFLCKEYRLIVEVDGGIHETQRDYDRFRTGVIRDYGYQVLRFTNKEVLEKLPNVLSRITETMATLTSKTPKAQVTPSPADGEGAGG